MPKQITEIRAFHGGINSNADPRDIKNEEMSAAQDIMVDEVGKVRMMGDGLNTTGLPTAASTAIEDGHGLFHTAFDWTMLSTVGITPISGTIAAGETITGAASGATALVLKNYNNRLYFINNRKGAWTGHGTWAGSEGARNFTYRVIQGDVVNTSATINLDATGYDVLTALGTPAIYVSGTGIVSGAFIASVNSNTQFVMNAAADATAANTNITFKEKITDASGASAYISTSITYPLNTGTSSYFIQDQDKVHLYDANISDSNTNWFENVIDLGTSTSNVQPVFYVVDGMLRVSDGNHANTGNSTQFFGYIPAKERVLGGSYLATVDGWFTGDAEVVGLSDGQFSDGPKDEEINAAADYGGTDGYIEMHLYENGGSSSSWNGEWKGGLTFIYDDGQESDLSVGPDSLTLDQTKETSIGITINFQTPNGGGLIPERVKKLGVYIQDTSSSEWWYQGEVDFDLGGLLNTYDIRQGWSQTGTTVGTSNKYKHTYLRDNRTDTYNTTPILTTTYKDRTGREVGDSTTATFKSAVIANRQVYASNIQQDSIVYGDRIMKSPVNKFDTFQASRSIEATINDGDEIVAIQSYADRILEFKKSKMTIINVSQEIEFLEETFPFKGITNPSAVCRSDYGIAWVNENGCFLFDGKQVVDLLDKNGLQTIEESNWQTFITDTSMIGFYPKKKQLIVVKDTSTSSVGDIYLFDMVTRSWVTGDSKLTDSQDYTNFINNVLTGDLIYAVNTGTTTFYSWRDTAQSGSILLNTKDLDFGHPAQRKKIYKAYVSYKGDGSAVTVGYRTNGETSATIGNFYRITSATDGSSSGATDTTLPLWTGTAGTTDWLTAELKPVSSINNVYSFQLFFGGTGGSDFEINDISIVYRLKNVK